jgi:hypothetical protein
MESADALGGRGGKTEGTQSASEAKVVSSVEFQALITACEILRNIFCGYGNYVALIGNAANLNRFKNG